MKRLQLMASKKLELTSGERPKITSSELLLRVDYCGICRTDGKMWAVGQRDLSLPRILGHEFCGTTEAGKHYVVWPARSCGTCSYCLACQENLCDKLDILGFNRDGGMAEWVTVPKDSLCELPATLSAPLSTLAEPLACAINAVENLIKASFNPLTTIIIAGGGVCGLLLALAALDKGLTPTIIEPHKAKRQRGAKYATMLNIEIVATPAEAMSFSGGINATASPEALIDIIKVLPKQGGLLIFSGLETTSIPTKLFNEIHYRQLIVSGAYGCSKRQLQLALNLLVKNSTIVEQLIEEIISLDEVSDKIAEVYSGKSMRYIIKLRK